MAEIENVSIDENFNDEKSNRHQDTNQKSTWRILSIIFISLLLDLLSFTIILPLLPSIINYYSKDNDDYIYNSLNNALTIFKTSLGLSHTSQWNSVLFGGFIGSLFSFLQFLTSPVIGSLSDIYGRRPMMLASLIGMSISYILWLFSSSFTIFLLSRIVGGISKGNVSLAIAIVADRLPMHERGKGMALIGVAYSIGFIVGPMIGAYFSLTIDASGSSYPFYVVPAWFSVILSLSNVMFIFIFFPETLLATKKVSLRDAIKVSLQYIKPSSIFNFSSIKLLSHSDKKEMKAIAFVYFVYLFLFSGAEFTLSFLTHERFDYGSLQQGKMFFFIGSVMIITQGGYVRRLKSGKEKSLILKGLMSLIISLIIIALVVNKLFFYFGLLLFSSASATVVPCLTAVISLYGAKDQKGVILGTFRSVGAFARAVGPFVACSIYWCFGPASCYILSGLGLLIPYWYFYNSNFKKID